jgi:hypothetical protein
MQPENERAIAGDNNPPEPTSYEKVRDSILSLYQQASDYLDGEPITSQGMADDVSRLMNMIREEAAFADACRKAEKAPHDIAITEIQDRYNLLIGETKKVTGKTVLAIDACKKALAPWLKKLADEQEAIAKTARKEAERKQREAEEALRASRADDLAARDAAEELVRDAAAAERAASAAAKAKPKAGNYGRSAHLRTYYDAVVVDGRAFHSWCVKNDRDAMTAYLARRAEELTAAGVCSIPGVEVRERKEVA